MLIGSIVYRNYTICLRRDYNPQNPRDKDNVGTMTILNKYKLGDSHNYTSDKWFDLEQALYKDYPFQCFMRPLHMIQNRIHIGYIPNQDSMIGFIYVTKKKAQKVLNHKRISSKDLKQLDEYFQQEIRDYNHYLNDDVYGFIILDPDENKLNDGKVSYGYYGDDHESSGLYSEGRNIIDNHISLQEKKN